MNSGKVNRFVEGNFHRHTLHDLDVVAHGVFRRQQAEHGPRTGLEAVHFPLEFVARIGIHADEHGLAGAHPLQLRLLEIGHDPEVVRHQRQQRLAGLDVSALLHRAARDAPVPRRGDRGVGKLQLRLLQPGPGLLDLGAGGLDVGAVQLDLRGGGPGLVAGHVDFRRSGLGLRFGQVNLAAGDGVALHRLVTEAVRFGAVGDGLGGGDGGVLLIGLGLVNITWVCAWRTRLSAMARSALAWSTSVW